MASLIYYEHYYCSRNDAKLIKLNRLMSAHGSRHGYALYHCTLEAMLELDGYCIDDIETVAMMIFEPLQVFSEFIAHCLELGLFVESGGKISSPRFSEWANRKSEIRCKNSENGKLGGRPRKDDPENAKELIDKNHNAESNKMVKSTQKSKVDKSADEQAVFDHWNSKGIVKHGSITKDLKTAIDKAVSAYGLDKVMLAITAYDDFRKKTDWYDHKWTLLEFLKRKNGLAEYVEKAVNVIAETKQKAQETAKSDAQRDEEREARKRLVSELTASPWHSFGSLRDLMRHIWNFPDKESKFSYIETMPDRMQAIVTAPASGMIRVLKEGVNPNLEAEYQGIKEKI